ncbi:MAG: YkgJ family cysteine cluster protein [Eubacteriales bacterium]|nr:YkgJ family cysteine cluster protein [Eubacteriales bacterium]
MLPPRKVKFEAQKRWNENIEFRIYLKCNADEKELDEQFKSLHRELFAEYDCSRCRNCCKMYHGVIPEADLERDAKQLGMSAEAFLDTYLEKQADEEGYQTRHKPCDFLEKDGSCKLGDCKPENCVKYPYTDQPDRIGSLYSILDNVEVCPVVFEIYERLKKEYRFR